MPTEIRGRSPNSAAPRSESGLRPRIWALAGALVLLAQVITLNALPFEILEPWDKVWHFLAYGALTLLLWIATDGRRPATVVAGVTLLGAWGAHMGLAAAVAALTGAALLLLARRPGSRSSGRA
jgi:hypothetical protein